MSSPDEVTGPVNIGNTEVRFPVKELAEVVIGMTGLRSK